MRRRTSAAVVVGVLVAALPVVTAVSVQAQTIVGWGWNYEGDTNAPSLPPGVTYTAIAAGYYHSLALRSDGTVVSWREALGEPPALPAGVTYTAIAAGDEFNLALRNDGAIVAWGYTGNQRLDVPSLPPGLTYAAIAAGDAHGLALRSNGTAVGWGYNAFGQAAVPAQPPGVTYTAISAGGLHSLALRSDGMIEGWGDNYWGQSVAPAPPPGVTYTAIAAGFNHSLALRSDGTIVGWGNNNSGETVAPTLPEGVTYTAIAAGSYYSLALRSDGAIVAWGWNPYDQLVVPELPTGSIYTAVAAGAFHCLAIRSDGSSPPPPPPPPPPPLANAGPDQNAIVGEPVAFDGSQSSSSDGSITSFVWDFGDGTSGDGATTHHVYTAAGTFTVVLTVTDDAGSATDTAIVNIQTQSEAIGSLSELVASYGIRQGIARSLDAKLLSAQAALTAGNAVQRRDAANKLLAFINEVEAQRGKALTEAQADELVGLTRRILALL